MKCTTITMNLSTVDRIDVSDNCVINSWQTLPSSLTPAMYSECDSIST